MIIRLVFVFSFLLLLAVAVKPGFAQEDLEAPPVRPTAWVRGNDFLGEDEPTPGPDAVPTTWAPTRPEYRRRNSQQQIVIPEEDEEEFRRRSTRERSEEQLDAVFGQ